MEVKKIKAVCLIGASLIGVGMTGVSIVLSLKNNNKNVVNVNRLKINSDDENFKIGDILEEVIIRTSNHKLAGDILENIHKQLAGNEDYGMCDIVLNDDVIIKGEEIVGNKITYTRYRESKTKPSVTFTI